MKSFSPVNLSDLLDAFGWGSATVTPENLAKLSCLTGKGYLTSRELGVRDELSDEASTKGTFIINPNWSEY
ncbi:MAG: hypothetical protein PHQ58_09100 [Rhodoferax sp.]|uniref:hypothetical protein n=1 Tax=Rhodoferax sp. TaxID=50421 RepID=UPI002609DF5A|nr:hypothetical protein [Rhodoferax sp.]MDD2880583.1 hypothetical protein [Rhodoferax sp.]